MKMLFQVEKTLTWNVLSKDMAPYIEGNKPRPN